MLSMERVYELYRASKISYEDHRGDRSNYRIRWHKHSDPAPLGNDFLGLILAVSRRSAFGPGS
jgi:hypothetical protein